MTYLDTRDPLAVAVTEAIHAGDVSTLQRLLADNPGLAAARLGDADPCGIGVPGSSSVRIVFNNSSSGCWHEGQVGHGHRLNLLSDDPVVFVQPCSLTMKLIQIGVKGDVQSPRHGHR